MINGERQLKINLCEDELSATFFNPRSINPPPLRSNTNAPPAGISIPKRSYLHFEKVANLDIECSFLANNCNSCIYKGGSHSIKDSPRAFFLGDSFIPPAIGGMEDCSPVIRINKAGFSDLKEVLIAQKKNGFFPHPGSVAIVCMLDHLLKIGNEIFWTQFDDFSTWLKITFELKAMPTLPPLPNDLSISQLISVQQFFKTLQGRFLGDFQGEKNDCYILWKAFQSSIDSLGKNKVFVPSPPVALKGGTILNCEGEISTSCGDFSLEMPPEVCKTFLSDIFCSLKLVTSLKLVLPVPSSIERGLKGVRARAAAGLQDPLGNTLFLYGTSILKAAADPLALLVSTFGVNVISKCVGGDFFVNVAPKGFPESDKPQDTLILHFLGNNMYAKKSHFLKDQRYHMIKPNFLDDDGVNLLILKVSNILKEISTAFKGKIFILGPFPRFLSPCCHDPSHSFPKSDIFQDPLSYCSLLNSFLSMHASLQLQNVSFVTYKDIFGSTLPSPFTYDLVHLTRKMNAIYVSKLSTLIRKEVKPPSKTLPGKNPSFITWASCQLPENQHCSTPLSTIMKETDKTTKADFMTALCSELFPAEPLAASSNDINSSMNDDDYIDTLYAELFPGKAVNDDNTCSTTASDPTSVKQQLVIQKLRQLKLKHNDKS